MSELEKVKLPREVAEALVRTKSAHSTWNNHDLCYIVLNDRGYCQYENEPDIKTLHEWSNTNELNFAKALMSGYEVEQTPEEKVIEMYEKFNGGMKGSWAWDTQEVIAQIITLLGHKIKGINE